MTQSFIALSILVAKRALHQMLEAINVILFLAYFLSYILSLICRWVP